MSSLSAETADDAGGEAGPVAVRVSVSLSSAAGYMRPLLWDVLSEGNDAVPAVVVVVNVVGIVRF
jgi:hypothetical protein